MGNPFSISLDPCVNKVSSWINEKVGYIHNLENNLVTLETTMEELRAKRDDLLTRVTREEDRGHQRLGEIKVWLKRVETTEKKVNDLLSARDDELQRLCLCGFCSKSLRLRSSCRYGKKVFLTLTDVKELSCRVFEVIVEQSQTLEVQERQLQPIIVGQETMLDKAWKHLKEDEVGIMGMYGMGGVGKTTLLMQINNKFSEERCGFDFVIWVVVSKELHVEKIQDEIAQKIGLGGVEKSQKADLLYNLLKKKRFVLFLDDIWEKLDLTEIGVPFPTTQNGCKVVFTTRSQEVCARMGVEDPMEVQCLADNEAFDLFQKKVGQRTLGRDPEIPNLARIVARKCGGLPLALNVIGETMSFKRTVEEWRSTIAELTRYATEFADMKDKILPLLKYSYDNLKEEHVKSCLLYCALFPEDDNISKKILINYMICEDIINGNEGIERAENKGYEIIGDLVRASLLMEEEAEKDGTRRVRMHDVVREMALWIASELGKEKEAFIVHAGAWLTEIPKVNNWKTVRRMSLMQNRIRNLAGSPECLELKTFLMQWGFLENISSEFFKSMPKLAVLDLSGSKNLTNLPDGVSDLVSLKYLNLSSTGIRHLPKGLQELKKLIHLNLRNTNELSSIAGISKLHNLMILDLALSGFSWDYGIVEELETLEHLEVLTLEFKSHRPLERFITSHRLTSCIGVLVFSDLESTEIAIPVTMNKMRQFVIMNCTISEIKMGSICIKSKTVSPLHNPTEPCFLSLTKVTIRHCHSLRELTLLMFASNLKELEVRNADQLEDIINEKKACEGGESGIVPFPKLVSLKLRNLRELTNIYWSPLRFPCLKKFEVIECPYLKKLPLDSQSGIHGENELVVGYREESWIVRVEWEDEATKTRFLSSCKYSSYGM